MFAKKNVEVLVAGAGPAGMMAALSLAENGVDTAIVDAAPRACTANNAVVIHPRTLKLFEKLGFAERLIDSAYRIDRLVIYDESQPRETIRLGELPFAYPYAVSLPQAELEFILEDELNQAGIRIHWDHRVSGFEPSDDGMQIDVDRYSDRGTGYAVSHTERVIDKTLRYHSDFLVAADGYNSILRRLAGAELVPLSEDQYFVCFEFETDMDAEHAIRISLRDGLATAQYPLDGGMARLGFQFTGMTLPASNRDKDRAYLQDRSALPEFLDDAHLTELIKQRVPWNTGYVNRVRYRAAIPFEKRYLKTPQLGQTFFLGDSARTFGPLGSLSLNLGLQEAETFALAYKASHESKALLKKRLGELSLNMIEKWKMLANLEKHTTPIEMADPWIAQNRARILRALPASGETLERLASQIFIHLNTRELVEA